MKEIINGIKNENPTFALMLGLCPTLAVTQTFERSFMMGLCVLFVLIFSNLVVSLIRKLVPENVKIPVFIIIIATFVTTLDLIIGSKIPTLHKSLGIYLPLITVNCIVLGRALSFASKNKPIKSILDGIGVGIGFTLSLSLIGLIREVLGTGIITIMSDLSSFTGYKMVYQILPTSLTFNILVTPAGAFITLGLLLALFKKIGSRGETK